ncbi:hypothetical protein Agub_g12909 [Astrephomene gubernaculifera]|uniref:Uncharacterized protein n=1 Tax=Astrephomene gubernaculifera TaxID=47775 RepID=A0AAD3HS68_9CHLO|nr:hypothetical protein Agub_g12909 [Astrephomene gubernaculifera]
MPALCSDNLTCGVLDEESGVGASEGYEDAALQQASEALTDDVLLLIFSFLAFDHGPEAQAASPKDAGQSFTWFRRTLPLVSRRWYTLLCGNGKYPWNSVIVSVEQEVARRRRAEASGGYAGISGASPTQGSWPPVFSPATTPQFGRPSMGQLSTLRSSKVIAWTEAHANSIRHLMLNFGSASHDFSTVEALLRAAKGLRTLRLIGAAGVGGQDSYEMLARLRGLAELHVSGLPQGFLAGTLPYVSSLSALTRLSFTPETCQFAVSVPALPTNLRSLSLNKLWIGRLPPLASAAPQLRELQLLDCFLLEGVLGALAGAPNLQLLRLDEGKLTTPAGERLGWEACRGWPQQQPLPALKTLSLRKCALRGLPAAALAAFPGLEVLDLSYNQDLGGAGSVPDAASAAAAAAAAAASLPPELAQLTALREVRLAGCGLTTVPAVLLRIPSITSLDLSSNCLTALPLPPPLAYSSATSSPVKNTSSPLPYFAGSTNSAAAAAAAASPASSYPSATRPAPIPARPGGGGAGGGSAVWGAGGLGAAAAAAAGGLMSGGGGMGGFGAVSQQPVALFADRLVRLNIAMNQFKAWPQGLRSCTSLRELVLGAPLLGHAEGELERCVAALPSLQLLEVRGEVFDWRAVRCLLGAQRQAAEAGGRPRVVVTPCEAPREGAGLGGGGAGRKGLGAHGR